jgi:peptide/nickel transport system substrate-binding protein
MLAWKIVPSSSVSRLALAVLLIVFALPSRAQDKVVTMTFTAAWTTDNPYGYSSAETNAIFCQTYGCLGIYDYKNKKPIGVLAESWEWINDTTMRFNLRRDLKRHDGGPGPTSKDIIHSLNITLNDKESLRRSFTRDIKEIREVDTYTFDMITKAPAVDLIISVFDSFIITSAELWEKHGRAAYTKAPHGWGPYKLQEIAVDDRAVMRKNPEWPGHHAKSPDVVIYRLVREPEQRVIGLLNGEIQIARDIPPQLLPRLQNRKDIKIIRQPSIEQMFLLFNTSYKPWDDVRVRRAAALSIDRNLIVDRLLKGLAKPLQGWINEEQICFTGPPDRPVTYDPKKARQLLDEAGYKGTGPEVEFYTSNGRYTSDRQIAEVIAQMLGKVGFKVKLLTPEWANLFADIQNGKTPMYYMGRGTVLDPGGPMITYIRSGATKRSSYKNAELDKLMDEQSVTFDEKKRCEILRKANQIVLDDMPMLMMWSHEVVTGTRDNIEIYVAPNSEVWHVDTRVN